MNWKKLQFNIADAWRKLWYHPVVYCLYEKTRKRQVTWDNSVTLVDGDLTWKFEWASFSYDRELNGYDDQERVFSYGSWGVDSLFSLVVRIQNEPTKLRREARVEKYLKENC